MLEEIRNIKSGRKELRSFAIVVAAALIVLGFLLLLWDRDYYFYLFVTAGAFITAGLLFPLVLWPLQKVWMTLSILLGWLITRIILGLFFYLVITPTGALGRLFGHRFLDLKYSRSDESYWIKRKDGSSEPADYEKQF